MLNMISFDCSEKPMCPTQKGIDLRDDILALVKFWHAMHSDKKYLKSAEITVSGRYLKPRSKSKDVWCYFIHSFKLSWAGNLNSNATCNKPLQTDGLFL